MSIAGYRARSLLIEIGKRLGVDYERIIQLSQDEVVSLLISHKKADRRLLTARLKSHGFLRIGGKFSTLEKQDVAELGRAIHKQINSSAAVDLLTGQPAFPGLVTGRIRVIQTIADISTMKRDEILVAPMTNPDYMPAIRKAKAIITDEGGILAHAAIVSRELEIPAVLGTKIASQALKSGDLVEVDANQGVVKILKRNAPN